MKTVKSRITYKEKASRWELFVRIIYAIPIIVVLWIFGILVGFAQFLQWFYILIFGKRHKSLHDFIRMYITYLFRIRSYLYLLTDERPPIVPEKI